MTIERKFHVLIATTFVTALLGGNIDSWLHIGVREKIFAESLLSLEFPGPPFLDVLPAWLSLGILSAFVILFTLAIYGFVNFRNWGRIGTLALTIVGLALQLCAGTRVVTAPSLFFAAMTLLLWGGALTVSFMEPLAIRFQANKSNSH